MKEGKFRRKSLRHQIVTIARSTDLLKQMKFERYETVPSPPGAKQQASFSGRRVYWASLLPVGGSFVGGTGSRPDTTGDEWLIDC